MTQPKLNTTISIFGCGDVGATLAYTLILESTCNQILLIDPKTTLLQGQVRDLSDATFRSGTGTKICAATPFEAGLQSDIIVITAGAKQKPGETRLALLHRNLVILKKIFEGMGKINEHAIVLLVANPVDVLTYFARKMSGLPEGQVLGTGTSLDSARLRGVLSEKAGVAPSSIDAYVLGEHGDSQFIAWSSATIGTTPLKLAIKEQLTPEFKIEIAKHTKGAAGEIIAAKGCTAYGIGNVAASICKYILFDSRSVRPLSFFQPDLGCCLSMPAVLGRKGIVRAMPVGLDPIEQKELESCAKGLRAVIKGAGKELSAEQELEKALEMNRGA